MSNELVIDASSSEISIALLEDKRLIELNKEKTDTRFSVGDIYLGKVKKIMPGLNAAFVDVGYEKDAFLHYLDLGPQFNSLNKYMNLALSRKGKIIPFYKFNRESDINKDGKITEILKIGTECDCADRQRTYFNKRPSSWLGSFNTGTQSCVDPVL